MDTHFILRGALNVPMEAFQGFCRAKTNFYVFEKIGKGEKADTPTWFKDGYVWVSNAPTIGLNKDGLDLFVVDENGSRTDVIDNKAIIDVQALMRGESTFTSGYIKSETMSKSYIAVPTFSGNKSESVLEEKVKKSLPGFKMRSLGDLIDDGIISVRGGHGSPSSDIRIGDIPYIKVVDLRAGRVNPNSTNMVPEAVAREFWHGESSGISAWEIATPSRASKNIGEPCMILPGQERMVLTKERNEFIAIGWNSVTKAMISQNLTRSQSDRLKASIKATYDESKPGTSLNKCIRFCYELKAGDIAVIVDNNRVAFAYIGEYYEEQSPTLTVELEKEVHQQIEKANPNTDTFTCPYIKRRKITLIKVLTADDTISPYLQSAIARNWHSLSDLNEYAELVLSGCFDTVLFKDKLTVTFRVKRKEEINVLDLANFVLCAARLLSDDKPETVQVKTTLHSPGDVILQIWNFAQENAFPLLICYMAIFGGKARDYEFHSIIGVIKGIINHKYDEDKKKIELRKLSAEADLAEQQALKQKLENIETMRRLQLSSVDAYAEPLATAAKNLAVQPSSATIIDITKILKSQQEDQPPQ